MKRLRDSPGRPGKSTQCDVQLDWNIILRQFFQLMYDSGGHQWLLGALEHHHFNQYPAE